MNFNCGTRSSRWLLAVGFVLLATFTLHAGVASLRGVWFDVFNYGVYYAILGIATTALTLRALAPGPDRVAWICIALASGSWLLGDVYYSVASASGEVPTPSPSDIGYLAFYPGLYCGLMLLVRSRVRRLDRSVWLDGG